MAGLTPKLKTRYQTATADIAPPLRKRRKNDLRHLRKKVSQIAAHRMQRNARGCGVCATLKGVASQGVACATAPLATPPYRGVAGGGGDAKGFLKRVSAARVIPCRGLPRRPTALPAARHPGRPCLAMGAATLIAAGWSFAPPARPGKARRGKLARSHGMRWPPMKSPRNGERGQSSCDAHLRDGYAAIVLPPAERRQWSRNGKGLSSLVGFCVSYGCGGSIAS